MSRQKELLMSERFGVGDRTHRWKINADVQAFIFTLVMLLYGLRIDEAHADRVRRVREHEKQLLSKSFSDASILAVTEALAAGENDPYGDGDQSLITHQKGMAGSNAQQPFRVAWSPSLGCNECMANLCRRTAYIKRAILETRRKRERQSRGPEPRLVA
jgi:hypothetical protein